MSVDGVVARVVRGDVECTNGYIHVIDRVLAQVMDIPDLTWVIMPDIYRWEMVGGAWLCYPPLTWLGLLSTALCCAGLVGGSRLAGWSIFVLLFVLPHAFINTDK